MDAVGAGRGGVARRGAARPTGAAPRVGGACTYRIELRIYLPWCGGGDASAAAESLGRRRRTWLLCLLMRRPCSHVLRHRFPCGSNLSNISSPASRGDGDPPPSPRPPSPLLPRARGGVARARAQSSLYSWITRRDSVAPRLAAACSRTADLRSSASRTEYCLGLGLANCMAHMLTSKSSLPVPGLPGASAFPYSKCNRRLAPIPLMDAGMVGKSLPIKKQGAREARLRMEAIAFTFRYGIGRARYKIFIPTH